MKKAVVTNSVNLNVNQNDLVDMLMEDLKEKLEEKVKVLSEKLKVIKEEREKVSEKVREVLAKQNKDVVLEQFVNVLKANKVGYNLATELSSSNEKKVAEYMRFDLDNVRRYKNPVKELQTLERNGNKVPVKYSIPDSFRMRLSSQNGLFNYTTDFQKPLKDKEFETVIKQKESLAKDYAAVDKELYETDKQLLMVEEGGTRFKSQFLRASLGKTKEGKQILDMVEQVKKGTKLLN